MVIKSKFVECEVWCVVWCLVLCVFVHQEIKVVGPEQEQNPSPPPIADVLLICLLAVKGGRVLATER